MQPKNETFIAVDGFLKNKNIDFDFYFEDIKTGEAFRSGVLLQYPFASCFKLAVLGALLEKFSDIELQKELVVVESDVPRLAMGVINFITPPIKLSLANMAHLMMTFSDGTSTDILIREIGFELVQDYVARNTEKSVITCNVNGLLNNLLKASLLVTANPKNITRDEYLTALQGSTMKQDYSNAKDLAGLLKALLKMGPRAESYLFRDQGVQRLGMYSLDNIRFYGKTGTLGYWVSANDCAVIVVDGEPRAFLGLMTLGWRQPRYIVEHAFGEVGLMISNMYRAAPVYSPAYGSE